MKRVWTIFLVLVPAWVAGAGEPSPRSRQAASAPASRPASRPATRPATRPAADQPFDRRVQAAIDRAVRYLWSVRSSDGSWPAANVTVVRGRPGAEPGTKQSDQKPHRVVATMPFPVGSTALVCFALLEAGVSTQDARMQQSLRWLARHQTTKTYSLGLRANVWQSAARQEARYLNNLRHDVRLLVRAVKRGAYSYDCFPGGVIRGAQAPFGVRGIEGLDGYAGTFRLPNGRRVVAAMPPDNSNSQFGLLGVWAGVKGQIANVPQQYWQSVQRYWKGARNPDGGWGYFPDRRSPSYPSMTVAGLASLYVCNDNLGTDRFVRCTGGGGTAAIEAGLAWLDRHVRDNGLDSLRYQDGKVRRAAVDMYYLFGVERVALASGYKYFGGLDWYRAGAGRILAAQGRDGRVPSGGWGSDHFGAAFAVLFLVRGRHPVLFNKLKFPGDWNNRPRDLANLTRWLSRTFERTVNWQIVSVTDPVEQWHDAPILYLSGAEAPKFTDEHLRALRAFVHQGGTLFSCAECDGAGFRSGMRQAYRKLFPRYELRPLQPTHDLFSAHFKVRGTRFHMVTNGVRPLAVHCDRDLPLSWQLQSSRTRSWTFEVAANLVLYVTGRRAFRPRGASHWPQAPDAWPGRTVRLARLKHAGNYDPEPLAYERLRRLLARREKLHLEVLGPLAIADLARSRAKLAALTGTGPLVLSADQRKALADFVAAGGTLLVDAAGGDEPFHRSAAAVLTQMYGGKLRLLASDCPLFRQPGRRIAQVRYRGRAAMRWGRTARPQLRVVLIDGRPAVLYSRDDLTTALLGTDCATCSGYEADCAYQILRNIVFAAAR